VAQGDQGYHLPSQDIDRSRVPNPAHQVEPLRVGFNTNCVPDIGDPRAKIQISSKQSLKRSKSGSHSPFLAARRPMTLVWVRLVLVRRAQSGEAVSGGPLASSSPQPLGNRRRSKAPTPGAHRPLFILGLDWQMGLDGSGLRECVGMEWKTMDGRGRAIFSPGPSPMPGTDGWASWADLSFEAQFVRPGAIGPSHWS
jgi:hypothetical protein